jgi:hypothetical protein
VVGQGPAIPGSLPVPTPLRLAPPLVPVTVAGVAGAAPTSVLVLGFGSVLLASVVLARRLLPRGR